MRVPLQFTKRSLLIAGASALATNFSYGRFPAKRPITLGQVTLSFYAVTGAVVHEVLERLGHQVTLAEGPHEKIFPMLANGEIDLMAAVWLPEGHAAYWTKYGRNALEIAKLYEGARFFWAVPSYVPEDEISSISDLLKPNPSARTVKTIQGIGSGAAISTLSQQALSDYKLDAAGYSFRTGTQADWIRAYQDAARERTWMIFPTWAPQYLNENHQLRPISDPLGVLGGENHASLAAAGSRIDRIPERTLSVIKQIHVGLDGVTRMDALVNVDGKSPREAARHWMDENRAIVEPWFEV